MVEAVRFELTGRCEGVWTPKRPPRGKLGAIGRSATLPSAKPPRPQELQAGAVLSVYAC